MSNNIIRTDKWGMSEQIERERNAKKRLDYLQDLRPAGAAPLTSEDLAIYGMFLQQDGKEVFARYMAFAYVDYAPFFMWEVTKAMNTELEKFT